jgi:hypothetical protein
MSREKGPLQRLALIESFLNRSAKNAQRVRLAFERLKKETASTGRAVGAEHLIDLFRGGSKRARP